MHFRGIAIQLGACFWAAPGSGIKYRSSHENNARILGLDTVIYTGIYKYRPF